MNCQSKVNQKLFKDLVTHISTRRIANLEKSQSMRDSKRENKQTCDGISASRLRKKAELARQADPIASISIRRASEVSNTLSLKSKAASQYLLLSNTT